jgi:adenine-specific DNA-methyltransferase
MADLGQVFTKGNVARYMVSLFDLPKQAAIMDPCFGAGSFLDALIEYEYENVTACEMDTILFENTKEKYQQYKLINGDFLIYNASNAYDGIVMNPPYIRQEKIDELEAYGITKERLRSNSIFSGLPSTANMYMYFIMKAIDLLKNGGQLIVIFPSSWMKAKSGIEFQKTMLSKCGIENQIHIHGDVFEREALVDVVILKLVKGKMDIDTVEEYLESKDGELQSVSIRDDKAFEEFAYPFSKLATIKRGLTTGCNEMYINPDLLCEDGGCFKPIISSPKSIDGYTTLNARLDRLFCPVEDAVSDEISSYLDFWKNKIIQEQKPKTLYMKVNSSDKWYEIREICGEGILFSYFVRNDMKFVMNETGVLARDNFYVIKPKVDKWVLFALLNNYYTYYQLELSGKKYGAGLLKLQRYDIEGLFFPNYEMISDSDKNELMVLSHKLLESADSAVIGEITKLISKYSRISYKEITDRYVEIKSNRLEVK